MLIPIKRLEESKTSFQDIMSEEQRRKFTLTMLQDMLKAAKRVKNIETAIVTPDEAVKKLGKTKNIGIISEPDIGLNRALEMAIGDSIESGFKEILIFPADIPLLRPEDIENIIKLASGEKCVILTPSKENGTNAMLLRPPDIIDLHFGGESFPEHVKAARSQNIKPQIYRSERLERDMDEPSHLLKLEIWGKGTKTHTFLKNLKK